MVGRIENLCLFEQAFPVSGIQQITHLLLCILFNSIWEIWLSSKFHVVLCRSTVKLEEDCLYRKSNYGILQDAKQWEMGYRSD